VTKSAKILFDIKYS